MKWWTVWLSKKDGQFHAVEAMTEFGATMTAMTLCKPGAVINNVDLNYFDRSAYKKMITPRTSMSIGDIVEIDEQLYMAVSVGFVELPISAEVMKHGRQESRSGQ